MSPTTIKVDSEVRDRLAAVARARHTTLSALLDSLSRRVAYEQMMDDADATMERTEHDEPRVWGDYLAELALWDSTAHDGADDTAAAEWPEYNTPEYTRTIGTRE